MSEMSNISFNPSISSGLKGINPKEDIDALSALAAEFSAGSFCINGTSLLNSVSDEFSDLSQKSQISLSSSSMGESIENIKNAVSSIANDLGMSFNDAINMLQNSSGSNIDIDPIDKKMALHYSTPFDEMKSIQALYSNFDDTKENQVDSTVVQAINPTYQSTLVF